MAEAILGNEFVRNWPELKRGFDEKRGNFDTHNVSTNLSVPVLPSKRSFGERKYFSFIGSPPERGSTRPREVLCKRERIEGF